MKTLSQHAFTITSATIVATAAIASVAAPLVPAAFQARFATRASAQDLPARVVPIQVNGPAASRFSLVVIGDGYTQAELGTFRENLEKHLNILWSLEPFRSYRNYINVYAVEVASPESGVTCDPKHREQRKTAIGLYYDGGCTNPNARGILVNSEEARRYARIATPDFDQILVIANTDTYGGIGGAVATTSGSNSLSPYITPHEIGHSLGKLQDEYTYYQRGVKGAPYKGREPSSIHHTLMTEDEMRAKQAKWFRWLGDPSESGGTIGRFEGGMYSVSGIWKPSKHSLMISLGYYFDQISRERLAQKISGQVDIIPASLRTDSLIEDNRLIWIETAHPNYASIATQWSVDGVHIPESDGARFFRTEKLSNGTTHTISVRATDTTSFVRDPAVRDTSFSSTRTWRFNRKLVSSLHGNGGRITGSTDTSRAVGGAEVVYVDTGHDFDNTTTIRWELDGRVLDDVSGGELPLKSLQLTRATHTLKATALLTPTGTRAGMTPDTRTWTVDNTLPTVTYTLGGDTVSVARKDGTRHYFVRDSFTMKLNPADDMPGYVVSEFRLNGDGWHHYYGWPDAPPGEPFHFTPRGTTIKELVYGSLSAEGLSPQPWETRAPGYGTHTIEYRARDAAGNVGDASSFAVTVSPSRACTATITGDRSGDVVVQSGVTCMKDAHVRGNVTVQSGASVVMQNSVVDGALTSHDASVVELVTTTIRKRSRISGTRDTFTIFGSTFDDGLDENGNSNAKSGIVVRNGGE